MPHTDHVVVIGGAGFIGRSLVTLLREAGCDVTVVSRSVGHRRDEAGLRYFSAEIADGARIDQAIEGASVVYDLATGGGPTWADFKRDYIDGALNVARACRKHGVRRMLFTSSISALYLGKPGKLYESPEGDPRARGRNFYSRAKAEAERALLKLHRTEGLPVVIIRPAIVVGRGGPLAHGALGNAASDTCILGWGQGNNPLPFVLVEDVAKAMFLAKDAPGIEGKAFNPTGDVRPTAREYLAVLRERTLRNYRFYPRNLTAMKANELLIWGFKTLVRKPDTSHVSMRDFESLTMAADLDCSLSKELLGWKPISDAEVFYREVIDLNMKPIKPGDIRLDSLCSTGVQPIPLQ